MAQTLFEISDEQRRIESMLEANEGEITPEIEQLMAINESNFYDKLEDYRNAIMIKKSNIESAKAEKERIAKYIERNQKDIERMTELMKSAMLQFDVQKVELNHGIGGKLSFRKSEKTVIDDEDWFYHNADDPNVAPCVVVKKSINLTEAKKLLQDDMRIPAHIESNLSLQVK